MRPSPRVRLLLVAAFAARSALAFDGELLLTPESERARVVASLTARGKTCDVAVLESVWRGDEEGFRAAARAALAESFDSRLARRLLSSLERGGPSDEAAALRARLAPPVSRPRLRATPPDVTARRPVVFLHGYSGDASTWEDFVPAFRTSGYGEDDLLVFEYYDSDNAGRGLAEGLTPLRFSENTPIETVAAEVAVRTREWLRRRAEALGPGAEIVAPDWICHSMGGLVFRKVLAEHPDLVHRCVDLATPHFGQNAAIDGQSRQMKYGSSFLWSLAEDWFFRGKGTDDMIFIVGVASHDPSAEDVMWDSLVCSFSATLLTLADGESFSNRTFFVNRVHTSALAAAYDNPGILSLDKENPVEDPVFRLAHGYLTDSGYFADGAVPTLRQTMKDDGASDTRIGKVEEKVASFGGLFVQAVRTATNSVKRLERPIAYDHGTFYDDPVITKMTKDDVKVKYSFPNLSGYFWEHGSGGDGCTNGLVLLFGNVPVGRYRAWIGEPNSLDDYAYDLHLTVAGGGVTVVRTRPEGIEPASAFEISDDRGSVFTETLPNAWFAEKGLVASPEDLAGCIAAGTNVWANGFTGAVSHWLGLDPADPDSTLAFTSVRPDGDSRDGLTLAARLGDRPLLPASGSSAGGARFVLQTREPFASDWTDTSVEQSVDGLWHVPATESSGLFRLTARAPGQ